MPYGTLRGWKRTMHMSEHLYYPEFDIKRSVILPAGWHSFVVRSFRTELSKAGDSTNYIFVLVSQNSNDKFNNVLITHLFNSKAKGFMIPFLEACDESPKRRWWQRLAPGKQYDPNDCVDKVIKCYVRVGEYNGKPVNELTQFRPAATDCCPSVVPVSDRKKGTSRWIDVFGYFIEDEQGYVVFNFGQHEGKRAIENRPYLEWMQLQDFPEDTRAIVEKVLSEIG